MPFCQAVQLTNAAQFMLLNNNNAPNMQRRDSKGEEATPVKDWSIGQIGKGKHAHL